MIVVIAVAVLVLVVIAAYFTGAITGSSLEQRREVSLNTACANFRSLYNCDPNRIGDISVNHQDANDAAPRPYTLTQLCSLKNLAATNQCLLRCGCQAPGP